MISPIGLNNAFQMMQAKAKSATPAVRFGEAGVSVGIDHIAFTRRDISTHLADPEFDEAAGKVKKGTVEKGAVFKKKAAQVTPSKISKLGPIW